MVVERDAGWLEHRSDEHNDELLEHHAVVLRLIDGTRSALVIHGTSRARSIAGDAIELRDVPAVPDATCFYVEPDSMDGRRLGLSKRTFFHRRAVTVTPLDSLRVTHQCSPSLYLELRRIAGFRG
jgi:hypothetical protein